MEQIIRTIKNCWKLKTLRYFKVLYNECYIDINKTRNNGCTFWINTKTGRSWIDMCDYDTTEKITGSLLHEIGHYIDFKKRKSLYLKNKKSTQISREKTAWKYALRLSDKYNLKIDLNHAQICLGTYNTNYKVLDNRLKNESKV